MNLNKQNNKLIIILVLFILSLLTTIVLYGKMDNAKFDYEKVKCVVTNVTKKRIYRNRNKTGRYRYIITVAYKEKEYKLKNTYDSSIFQYQKGALVDVYLSNGNLYANEAGVRTSTPVAILYFIFLFATMGIFFIFVVTWDRYRKAKNNM